MRVSVPLPFLVTEPVPLTVLEKTKSSERLMARVPLLRMFPAIEPVVPPSPSCRVPAEMVVLVALARPVARTSVPLFTFTLPA